MKEKTLENKIKNYIKIQGGWVVKFFANGYTRRGIPDLLICFKGRFIAIEVKSSGGRLSPLQKNELEEIKKAGGLSFVCNPENFEELKRLLEEM